MYAKYLQFMVTSCKKRLFRNLLIINWLLLKPTWKAAKVRHKHIKQVPNCVMQSIKVLFDDKHPNSNLQYTTTQRGRIMLIYNGYRFVVNRQSQKNVFWRCSRYVKHCCRATLVTSKLNDVPLRIAGSPHTHGPEVRPDECSSPEFTVEIMDELSNLQ